MRGPRPVAREVPVRVEVDVGGALLASTHLMTRGSLIAARTRDCDALPAGLRDPVLADGAAVLADVAADVLELVARDLELLADKVRAGAVLYDRVEQRVRDGMSGR